MKIDTKGLGVLIGKHGLTCLDVALVTEHVLADQGLIESTCGFNKKHSFVEIEEKQALTEIFSLDVGMIVIVVIEEDVIEL